VKFKHNVACIYQSGQVGALTIFQDVHHYHELACVHRHRFRPVAGDTTLPRVELATLFHLPFLDTVWVSAPRGPLNHQSQRRSPPALHPEECPLGSSRERTAGAGLQVHPRLREEGPLRPCPWSGLGKEGGARPSSPPPFAWPRGNASRLPLSFHPPSTDHSRSGGNGPSRCMEWGPGDSPLPLCEPWVTHGLMPGSHPDQERVGYYLPTPSKRTPP
jgi:hypothetical protein